MTLSMKVASLLPAATEMLCAVGAEEMLAGVSHECDFPPGVAGLPALTRTRLNVEGVSMRIHESMTRLVENALSVYEVDVERLKALDPDIIVTQDLCEVCAVSYDDVCAAVREMTGRRARIIPLHPTRLDDLYHDILRIGDAVDRAVQADGLVETLKARMQRLADRALDLPPKTVLLVEWLQPVMAGGLWSADLAMAVGARALATEPGAHARTLSQGELAALDPDVVVIKPCGFALDRIVAEISLIPEYLPWSEWRAARAGRVFVVDGNAYFNRSGPRLVDSAEILAGCVHESEFSRFRRQYAGSVKRLQPDLSIGAFHDKGG